MQEVCVTKEKLHTKCFVLFYCFACKNCNLPFSILDCAEDQRSSFESRLSTYSWAVLYITHSSFITFVPSLTVILWLTLFNASATLLPSTKKAEDSPLNEWNYKNKIFSISYWKQSQLLAGLTSKKEEMQSEFSCLCSNKITARGKYYYSPAIFYLKHPTHTPVCIFWKVYLLEKHFAPPSVPLILRMTG